MKKNSPVKDIIVPALCLLIIGGVCTGLLAGTNLLTKDKIAQIDAETKNAAVKSVMSEADDFKGAKASLDGTDYDCYICLKENEKIGLVVPVTVKSYGGALSLMVGIDSKEDRVTGVSITEINDTPGLGMKAKNDEFKNQFTGKKAGIEVVKGTAGDNEIQAITSATITSKAVTLAVNTALNVYSQVKAGGELG